jgi:hypothetical protein
MLTNATSLEAEASEDTAVALQLRQSWSKFI